MGDRVRIVVAIHDPPVWSIPADAVARLASLLPDDEIVDVRDPDERRAHMPTADVLFATKIKAHEFASDGPLRWIHSSAVGVGPLLIPEVVHSPVVVTNSKGVHSEAIAEHAVALMLALRRSLHVAFARHAEHQWAQTEIARRVVSRASNTRLLVIGLGSIGARVASMGAGLGMHVTGIRRRVDEPVPSGVSAVLPPTHLHAALAEADVIVLALPRTEQTRAIIGAAELRVMKRTSILINIARGRLVDETALAEALETGSIGGAGLDAFHEEPLPAGHRLWRTPNTVITPHTASFAGDYWAPVVDLFVDNIARYRRGEPLVNVVAKALGY